MADGYHPAKSRYVYQEYENVYVYVYEYEYEYVVYPKIN